LTTESWNAGSSWPTGKAPTSNSKVTVGGDTGTGLLLTVDAAAYAKSLTIAEQTTGTAAYATTVQLNSQSLTVVNGVKFSDANSTIDGAGALTARSYSGPGTISAGAGSTGGTLDVTGTINSGVVLAIGTAAPSDLKIESKATSAAAISITSSNQTLEVGASGALIISAAESITNGTIQLDGGSLTDKSGLTLGSGSNLTGFGTVTTGTTAATELQGAGTVTASGGTLTFADAVDQTGTATTFQIANGAKLAFNGAVGTTSLSPTIAFATGTSGSGTLVANGATFNATITNFVAGDSIDLTVPNGDHLVNAGGGVIQVVNGSNVVLSSFNIGAAAAAAATITTSGTSITIAFSATCFMAGTLIRTPDGEAPVESLKRGDLVLTSDGLAKPVAWLGIQTISTLFADPLRVWPIRIKAGALADNVPVRDLVLSPDHAVLVEGALIHAGALVNGRSIVRETRVPRTFAYYHIELEDHSLILAEGAPAETFIDNVDRLAFDNWAEHEALYPRGKDIEELPYPRAKAHRQVPMATRAKLAERAEIIGAGFEAAA
jgi:hypothetical protein